MFRLFKSLAEPIAAIASFGVACAIFAATPHLAFI